MQDNPLYNYNDPTLQETNVGFSNLVRYIEYIEEFKVKNRSNLLIKKLSRSDLEVLVEDLMDYINSKK
jgi:hypothetical protein